MTIDLHSYEYAGGADENVSRILDWNIATQWALVDRIVDQAGQKFTVYVHKDDEKKRSTREAMVVEYLVPDQGRGIPDVYFDCLRHEANPAVGCTGKTNFGRNLSLEFSFKRTELQHWPAIREAVLNLLNGLRQQPER